MTQDRYGSDVLSHDPHERTRVRTQDTPAAPGLVVEDVQSGWVGAVVRVEKSGGQQVVVLEDRKGRSRTFPLGAGFWVEGKPVRLVPHRPAVTAQGRTRTASGSLAVAGARARVARGSRIWVEGRHDAELVEKVWGDDLRIEGVVVELLDGVDNLDERLTEFAPEPGRRVGVLVDHLVSGSKESRVAADIVRRFGEENVLVVGHPYVDVWQAVKPGRLGLQQWPHVPRGTDIKVGTLTALGWPARDQADIARGWKRILGTVRDYRDLEPSLLGRVEELVDFVTAP
ncbi:DUF3097 domain-containing protein [Ruania halotolerans]|uniref:DUF3097 domain-containing protein n=1 Tax=Ruania halotolerans TaxID=2897773 RepID=UPI001E2C458A|nr:DUF3097 domain-containing protein [Ruania halotolerans]UFU04939.1 DUF3097 domain-containing protein [Ruania halotolerans]